MNATQASSCATEIAQFVQLPQFLASTYATISVPCGEVHFVSLSLLVAWDSIFPYRAWHHHNPTMVVDSVVFDAEAAPRYAELARSLAYG